MREQVRRSNFRWLIASAVLAVVLALLVLLLQTCHTHRPPPGAGAAKANPKPADFVGVWSGRWDGTWAVRFTVTPHPANAQQLSVVYEWEERAGQPMNRRERAGIIEGDALVIGSIEIKLSANDPKHATAIGHFANPRKAALTRP